MTHDPLCRFSKKRAADDEYDDCEYCDLIAQVRADEREQAAARVETLRNLPGLLTISAAAALAANKSWRPQL